MEQVLFIRGGRYSLRAHGEVTPAGEFVAVFKVLEHDEDNQRRQIFQGAGDTFPALLEAIDAAMDSARNWAAIHLPV